MPARSLNTYIFMINREDDTAIENLNADSNLNDKAGAIYSLNGQRLMANGQLHKGIYIMNGKKVLIK